MSLGITYILLSGQPQLLKPSDAWAANYRILTS